jgi:hypothetical protein
LGDALVALAGEAALGAAALAGDFLTALAICTFAVWLITAVQLRATRALEGRRQPGGGGGVGGGGGCAAAAEGAAATRARRATRPHQPLRGRQFVAKKHSAKICAVFYSCRIFF